MKFNSKTNFNEQDYQLIKETVNELSTLPNDVKILEKQAPEIAFGPGSFTIEKNVPFYGFVAGMVNPSSIEDILGGGTNLSCDYQSMQGGIAYGSYPCLSPIVWDGTKGSIVLYGGVSYDVVLFTLQDDTKPGALNLLSNTNVYTIKINLKNSRRIINYD